MNTILSDFSDWTICDSVEAMAVAAARLASLLPENSDCTLALHGTLGAGKTTFVSGLAQALEHLCGLRGTFTPAYPHGCVSLAVSGCG